MFILLSWEGPFPLQRWFLEYVARFVCAVTQITDIQNRPLPFSKLLSDAAQIQQAKNSVCWHQCTVRLMMAPLSICRTRLIVSSTIFQMKNDFSVEISAII